MALLKKGSAKGGGVVYWTLARIDRLNYTSREIYFTLLAYRSEADSQAENAWPIETRGVVLREDEFDKFLRNEQGGKNLSLENLYEAARFKDPLFADAANG